MDELNRPHLPPPRFVACLVQEIVCFNAKHLTTISTDARCCGAACPAEAGCHSAALRKFWVSSAITARLSQRLLTASRLRGAAWGSRNDPTGKLLAYLLGQDRGLSCPPPHSSALRGVEWLNYAPPGRKKSLVFKYSGFY